MLAVFTGVVIREWPQFHRAMPTASLHAATNQIRVVSAAISRTNTPLSVAATKPVTSDEMARRAAWFADFQRHPFSVVREDTAFGWTSEDGKNPDVIRKLAHNELEFERLAEESDRIYRRELVYHKDTVDAQIQRAKLAGQPM